MDRGEEDRRDGYRKSGIHPPPAAVLARFALSGIVQKAPQHDAPAHPFLKQWSENAGIRYPLSNRVFYQAMDNVPGVSAKRTNEGRYFEGIDLIPVNDHIL